MAAHDRIAGPASSRGGRSPATVRLTGALLGALTLALLGVGRVEAYLPAAYGGVVTAPLPDRPATLDPSRASRESELQLAPLLYDSLFRLGPAGRALPHLIEPQPVQSPDGLTWRLRLRAGVTLHTGQTLTAGQVVEALNRLRRGPAGYLLAAVRAISVEGEEIVFQLARRTPELPQLLATPATGIALGQDGRWIGTGPFRLAAWTSAGLTLVAHRTYFAGRPFLDELRFKLFDQTSAAVAAFQVGTVQLSLHGTSVFGTQPRFPFGVVESPVSSLLFLAVGRARPYLGDAQLRLALLKGIDRQRLGRLAGSGRYEVADGLVSVRWLPAKAERVAFDRAGASRILAQLAARSADLRREMAGGRLRLALLLDDSRPEDRMVAGQIVADLDRIGIGVTLEPRPAKEYQERLEAGRFELALGRQVPQIPVGAVALAGALAAAGDAAGARKCLASARCGEAQVRAAAKQLPLLPLVHTSTRVAHDARLGDVRLTASGAVLYPDLHLVRGGP